MQEKKKFFDLTIEDICLLIYTIIIAITRSSIIILVVLNVLYCIIFLCRHEYKLFSFLTRLLVILCFAAVLGFFSSIFSTSESAYMDLDAAFYPFIIVLTYIPMAITSIIVKILKKEK